MAPTRAARRSASALPSDVPAISRRAFAARCLALGAAAYLDRHTGAAQGALPPWSPGELDIHHIDTGRGSATFVLGPDGTTMLIDCGASNTDLDASAPHRPNASRRPGEWVARYALHHGRAARRDVLDYLIASHVHPDHVGDVPVGVAIGPGGFVPTGVSHVDQLMPVTTVIDRGYPDYGMLSLIDAPFARNYHAWLESRRAAARRVEAVDVGSDRQIRRRDPERFPQFSIRALAANGRVWTGTGAASRSLFPDLMMLDAADRPSENVCSIALRIAYGGFSYFTAGDLTADTRDGRLPWMDTETPVVRAAGRVEVAAANHHGYFDACGPEFTRNLDAQAYVIAAWHVTHPGSAQIERLIGAWPGERPRDVFATEMLPANRQINERWVSQMRSVRGHVIVRVASDTESYRIFVTDSTQELGPVTLACGPYRCRG